MLLSWVVVAILAAPPAARQASAPARMAAAAAPTEPDPITHLLPNLWQDLEHLPTAESGLWIVSGSLGAAVAHPFDRRVDEWARARGPSSAASVGNTLGGAWVEGGGALATWAVGAVTHAPEVTALGTDLIRAQVLNGLLTATVKYAADRRRPMGGSYSLPSGHTSATAATAAVLWTHYGWEAGLGGSAATVFVAWARTRSEHHWLSDVVLGAAMGALSGRTVARGHRANWTVVPVAAAGGAGVLIVWRPDHL